MGTATATKTAKVTAGRGRDGGGNIDSNGDGNGDNNNNQTTMAAETAKVTVGDVGGNRGNGNGHGGDGCRFFWPAKSKSYCAARAWNIIYYSVPQRFMVFGHFSCSTKIRGFFNSFLLRVVLIPKSNTINVSRQ